MAGATLLCGDEFQSKNGTDQEEDEEHPPEVGGLLKKKNPHQHSSYCADACPDSICCPDRNILYCFIQEIEARRNTDEKQQRPSPVWKIIRELQACSEAHFKQPGQDEIKPAH